MSDLTKLGGLWENKDKNGNTYFNANFSPFTKILIYKNTYKKQPSDPDWNMFLAPKKKGDAENSGGQDDLPY